jgi:hypothetical protein
VATKRRELGDDYAFSLSFGELITDADGLGRIDELLARSDELMYETKRARHARDVAGAREDLKPPTTVTTAGMREGRGSQNESTQ